MDFKEITFSRKLHFRVRGVKSQGLLCIGGVEKCKDKKKDGFWVCYWSLFKIHPEKGKIYGVDALDAFLNCIQFIIRLIEEHRKAGYEVWWNVKGDLAGLTSVREVIMKPQAS
jgi:hypothetical protein